jgi:transposase InsO family protein
VLWEPSKMEQRYDAVLGVIRDGFTVTEVARKFGVSRQTVHAWMARYEAHGIEGLDERSRRPIRSPAQIEASVEARIVELRRHHPSWGPVHLRHQLEREGLDAPSPSSIYRALRRHGLIVPGSRRRVLPVYKRWERARPMELWQMDVVGGFMIESGEELKVLTGIDDHSRFLVCAGVMARATSRAVCGHLVVALERHGAPQQILTDNGKVFTNRFGLTPAEVLFDRLCRDNGIEHLLTAPGHPTTTGKIERFHRTMRQEFQQERTFASLSSLQSELDAFVDDYNNHRPHQSLKMATPAERFWIREVLPEVPLDLAAARDDRSGDDWISRTVSANGTISISNHVFSVGKQRGGHQVDVRVLETLYQVWDGGELIKAVPRASREEVRKKRAERHAPHKKT